MHSIPQASPGLKLGAHRDEIEAAIARVLSSGRYILGEETGAFELEFSEYTGVPNVVGVNSGTDALMLALDAFDIGPGDEVLVPAITAPATAVAVMRLGAKPKFIDVDLATRGIDPSLIQSAIGPRTRAIIVVHLHGIPANVEWIAEIGNALGLVIIEDCAQAHGARIKGTHVGSFGHAAAFSFYPTKNLGCFGDGGCVATSSKDIAERVRRRRFYGFNEDRVCVDRGLNSRLDEIQAAILRVFLRTLDQDNCARASFARVYNESLTPWAEEGLLSLPPQPPGCTYHQYAITSPKRDQLKQSLAAVGIGTNIHYHLALPHHPAFAACNTADGIATPIADLLAASLLSLPIQPELLPQQDRIVSALLAAVRELDGSRPQA
jgi:dTDP-4-amino-4,6-dideoxygalactose transaminase